MKRTYEIQVCIPPGCRLVGCKTDGDIAVVIFEDVSGPEIRQRIHPRAYGGGRKRR